MFTRISFAQRIFLTVSKIKVTIILTLRERINDDAYVGDEDDIVWCRQQSDPPPSVPSARTCLCIAQLITEPVSGSPPSTSHSLSLSLALVLDCLSVALCASSTNLFCFCCYSCAASVAVNVDDNEIEISLLIAFNIYN